MKHFTQKSIVKFMLAAASVSLVGSVACAQTNGGKGAGLDKLDEQQVMTHLAASNLETLLNRDFTNFKIPADEQAQTRTFIELRMLQSSNLSVADRRTKAVLVAKGFDVLLTKAVDPEILFGQANQLFFSGIVPTVAELEYFGDNPIAQTDLRPVADTAKKMYVQVGVLAETKLNVLAKGINNVNFATIQPKLIAMKQLKSYGLFSDNMGTYSLCIALDKNDPKRASLAEASIKYLHDFDNAQSTIQSTVRLQIGKLQLARVRSGDTDKADKYDEAKKTLDTIVAGTGITPPPTVTDQNNARYFGIVALIASRKLNDAEKAIPDLENWEIQSYLPTLPNPSDQKAVQAALSMLKFRLYSAQSDLANIAAVQQQKNNDAIDVLAALLKKQPVLKDLVFDQLIGRIPEHPDYPSLNPLILQALQQQGFAEVLKPDGAALDQKKLSRSIDAAKELVSRSGQPGVDAATAGLSSYFIAYAYDKLANEKEAAAAFLDFAEKFPNDPSKSEDALSHAGKWIFSLRKKDPEDQDTRKLYDRFLPLAIKAPYNRKEFAFSYGALLQGESKFKEAVEYFEQVPKTDSRYANAKFLELLSLYRELSDTSLAGSDREAVVRQILNLDKTIDGLLAGATKPEDKAKYVEWVVMGDEIAADLTLRELKDPAKSLEILNGFEERVAGAKDPSKAHLDALQLRIGAYMQAKQTDEAVKALVALLKENPVQGQKLLLGVLQTVEHDENETKDADVKKALAASRAQLSSFLVDMAMKSQDPKEQANLKIYQLYDADAKREAAEMDDNAAAKKTGLQAALNAYQMIFDKTKDDAALEGVGLTQYDLGNYQEAMNALGTLVTGNKVGQAMMEIGPTNERVENPQFWEANYKDIRSIVEVYKKSPAAPDAKKNLESARQYVGVLYINNGKNTGGKTYHDDFEKLKAEIASLQSGTPVKTESLKPSH